MSWEILATLGRVIVPVVGLIAVGRLLGRTALLGEAGARDLAQVLYWVALPAQLLLVTSRVDVTAHFAPAALGAILAGLGAGMAGAWWATGRLPAAARGCVMNGAARANGAFIGLPVIELASRALPAPEQTALVGTYAVLLGPSVIAFNIAAVIAFRLPHHGVTGAGLRSALIELPRSPLILACAAGGVLGAIRPGLLGGTAPVAVIELLAATAVPLALLTAGRALDFSHLREHRGTIAGTCLAKLALVPAVTWTACRLLGVDHQATVAATILMASPAAFAAVPMARLLGGDAALMAALVTATTVAAPMTVLAWLVIAGP